ncbi:outer membrane beta-barrel protein [Terriglobus roseus]|uniref:Putative beta-barrel porin-2, OmpL-like. bbp2 n=1 Tax=Terriglobus roseus TaxID=392734 RepID=A0A1G7GZJ8_9BACT|nr:outer membrane beta-barrel protein [Terriglobus roseus]SDE93483.1 Putative beta-barrel porin-2, OmpL-like. bbp2 [Terriglobus roseus]
MKFRTIGLVCLMLLASATALPAQAVISTQEVTRQSDREAELRSLRQQLKVISDRLEQLEAENHQASTTTNSPESVAAPATPPAVETTPAFITATDSHGLSFLRGTTLSFGVDGYYGYNFNAPVGRVNLLRAFDVTSNNFSLNQVNLVVEHLPTPESRLGGRIDLQFGQATETLQGSPANEQRPQVWRNLFQSYGSYLAPVGTGIQLDFGKFASSLGNEGNYSKDQILYSRAYSFDYLPFYHMGLRASYNFTPKLNFTYWLVNGANETEDFNGFKSQGFLFTLHPASSLTWNVNYYFGQEARDVLPSTNSPTTPSLVPPGLPIANISPAPNGREHIFDTYATWRPTTKLTFIGEADYVLNRTVQEQQPGRVVIGSLTAKYALPHDWNLGARTEYFDDRGGLFSGTTQALKEATVSLDRTFAPGFIARAEYRRDWSNQRYFLSDTEGSLLHAQTTATLGLMYWWGTKQGSW